MPNLADQAIQGWLYYWEVLPACRESPLLSFATWGDGAPNKPTSIALAPMVRRGTAEGLGLLCVEIALAAAFDDTRRPIGT